MILLAPSGPPLNVIACILNETSIKVNWTISSSQANGYIIVFVSDYYGESIILSTTLSETVINNTTLVGIYNISVYSYKDVPSINSTHTVIGLNGIAYYCVTFTQIQFLVQLVHYPV